MRLGVLGPLLVVDEDGAERVVAARRQRTLLAALLVSANRVVSVDALAEILWDGAPPVDSFRTVRAYAMRLRRAVGPRVAQRIVTRDPGYLCQADERELDVLHFESLVGRGAAARRERDWATVSGVLAEALALWRGELLADIGSQVLRDMCGPRLEAARLQAVEWRIEADLHLGRDETLVSELRALVNARPLHERFHAQLMVSLNRCGRQAEALEVYGALRSKLVEELGVEPSAQVQDVHRRILAADPALCGPAGQDKDQTVEIVRRETPPGIASDVSEGDQDQARSLAQDPARYQLPAASRAFTGRERELEELLALASSASRCDDHRSRGGQGVGSDGSRTLVICAIDGMAGIGKTALALRTAHLVRDAFPDGQFFLDLHGRTPGLEPLTAREGLDWLLRSLGVPAQSIPQGIDQRAALYRDRLSGTRSLIVLDNAHSSAQVRPLLPGSPGCLVLVTSRTRLSGLDEAHSVALDVLTGHEAATVLHEVAGHGRIAGDDPALGELIALCGRLPLALRIAAARLRHQPALRVEDLVARLRDEHVRLAQLADEDRSIRSVLDSSHAGLSPAEQQLFSRLSVIPGPDFDGFAAAALCAVDRSAAERLLDSLLAHNLLIQHDAGRYRFHDLVRLYARTLSREGSVEEHEAALERLLDYYERGARSADRHISRNTGVAAAGETETPSRVPDTPDFPGREQALAWMAGELENLAAAARLSATRSDPRHAVTLAAHLNGYLCLVGPHELALALHDDALKSARRTGDLANQARTLHDIGIVKHAGEDYRGEAEAHRQALDLYALLGDTRGEAAALNDLGMALREMGDHPGAVAAHKRALDLFHQARDSHGQADALCNLGLALWYYADTAGATLAYEQALKLYIDLEDPRGQGTALKRLGMVRRSVGDCAGALEALEQALVLFRGLFDVREQATVLTYMGNAHQTAGDDVAAVAAYRQALESHRRLQHRGGQSLALTNLGLLHVRTGEYAQAASEFEQALDLCDALGGQLNKAWVLSGMGELRQRLGEFTAAAEAHEQALELIRRLGVRGEEARALNHYARVFTAAGKPADALSVFEDALRIARDVGKRDEEGMALEGIGISLAAMHAPEEGEPYFAEAAQIFRELGLHGDADRVQARLAGRDLGALETMVFGA